MNRNKYLLPLIFSIILIIGLVIGSWYGSNFYNPGGKGKSFFKTKSIQIDGSDLNFSLLPRTNKITSILSYIQNEYVDTVNVDKLTESVIPVIIDNLDPHSVYISAKDLQKYNEPLVGNFSGIGIQFNLNNDTVAVINTIPNGPSEIVGIMPGDRIIKVDTTTVAGKSMATDSIVSLLRGIKGTTVKVTVLRYGSKDLLEFEITRDDIPLYSIDVAYMLKDNIGYMKITSFSQTTSKEFIKNVTKLHDAGMTKLILDLRNNGGGLMDAATNIADQFLDENKLIVYTQGKARPRSEVFSTSKGICKKDKIVILIDEFSASASEILAGAIQDNDRGTIVGRRSFGKGLVQEQIEFRDGSALRLTIARYYTPTGRSIQKPYTSDKNNYYLDLSERFEHGEFEHSDSIKFADSLKYITPGGKTVYGGGGIMPDVFVPFDTTGVTPYFNKVRNLGLIYRFAFDYTDKHRKEMAKFTSADQISKYLDRTTFFNDFIKYGSQNEVKADWTDIGISRTLISTQIKAYIARNMIDNEGFYPIIGEIDNTLLKAEEILSKN